MKLFKYFSPDSKSIVSILEQQQVYFSTPDSFNDPFECKPSFPIPLYKDLVAEMTKPGASGAKATVEKRARKSRKEMVKLLPKYEKMMNNAFAQFSMTCFTTNNANLLMWAHYAKNHEGICMEFDIEQNNFHVDDDFGLIRAVSYKSKYPSFNFSEIKNFERNTFTSTEEESFLIKTLYTKSLDWAYEDEYRAVADPSGKKGIHAGLRTFSHEKLKGVIFGARANKSFINEVKERVKLYPSKIYTKKAFISRTNYQLIVK